jgi:hypothetical protein
MLMHKLNCRLGQSNRVFTEVIKMASEIGDEKAMEAAQDRVKTGSPLSAAHVGAN